MLVVYKEIGVPHESVPNSTLHNIMGKFDKKVLSLRNLNQGIYDFRFFLLIHIRCEVSIFKFQILILKYYE